MSKRDFVVGDIVRAKCNGCGYEEGIIGEVYSVRGISPNCFIDIYDKNNSHLMLGCLATNFELYTPHKGKILIMVDEKDSDKIIARDLLTNKTAEAKRNPKDYWDFAKGAKLALERLTEPEKPKYWTGKVVCIGQNLSAFGYIFTVGKIYHVDDGKLFANHLTVSLITGITSPEDIERRIDDYKFIEYKGGAEE